MVLVREAIRRFHPDKFAQRFGNLMGDESNRTRVMLRVKEVAQQINVCKAAIAAAASAKSSG
jgi:hypothetical protein